MTTETARVRRRGGPTKGDQREAAILEATRDLLSERSMTDLTIDAIAKTAGVSRTAFYFYFPTKQAVLAALLDGLWDQFGATHGWLASDGLDREALLEHHHQVARVWQEHGAILTCTYSGTVDYEPIIDWVHRARGRLLGGLATKIARDQAAGVALRGVEPAALAEMVVALRDARFREIAALRGVARERALADLTDVIIRIVYGQTP